MVRYQDDEERALSHEVGSKYIWQNNLVIDSGVLGRSNDLVTKAQVH
jgi:hypothetical protein